MNSKKKSTDSQEKKRLYSNILSLSILQGVNYLLPLLTIPYLVRILGPEYFGLIAFSSATISFFVLLTDYGFNLSATKQISIYRDDSKKINEIFNSVMTIKFILMVVSFVIVSLMLYFFVKLGVHWEIYYLTFGIVIGQMLFPVWLFRGMECMWNITYLNVFSKTLFTLLVFMFVKEQSDYLLVPLFTSLGFILVGFLSLFIAKNKFKIHFHLQPLEVIKYQLNEGLHIFYSSVSISIYTIFTVFILGIYTNDTIVGYFSAADKIIQAVKGLYSSVSLAIYPYISKKMHENKLLGLMFVKKILVFVAIPMFFISLILFYFADPIVNIVLGKQYHNSILLLKIMAFLPFLITLSNLTGVQVMLNLGYKRLFSKILLSAAILGMIMNIILVPKYQSVGSALVVLFIETYVTVVMFISIKRKLQGI